jgi:hypothetical protein
MGYVKRNTRYDIVLFYKARSTTGHVVLAGGGAFDSSTVAALRLLYCQVHQLPLSRRPAQGGASRPNPFCLASCHHSVCLQLIKPLNGRWHGLQKLKPYEDK